MGRRKVYKGQEAEGKHAKQASKKRGNAKVARGGGKRGRRGECQSSPRSEERHTKQASKKRRKHAKQPAEEESGEARKQPKPAEEESKEGGRTGRVRRLTTGPP